MDQAHQIVGINELLGFPLQTSRFSRAIATDHQPFFGGRSMLAPPDTRAPLFPTAGPSITEPGLAERWRDYDQDYRAASRISSFWITEVEEATVFPPFGIVAVKGRLVRDTIRNGDMLKTIFPEADPEELKTAMRSAETQITSPAMSPVRRVAGSSFLLGFGMFNNYFNWTLRYASRVALFQAMPAMDKLVAPAPSKRYIADTLEFMGVRQEQVEHLDGPVVFERLTIVSPVALGRYEISPLIVSNLRGHPRVTELWRRPKRRLYIPRRDVKLRQVVNEAQVEAALHARGFETFDNSQFSVREQVRAFRDAAIVVAPHGAGLANIVYCDAGTQVVELIPEGYDQGVTSYRSLADLFELPYTQIFAREAAPDRKGNRCNAHIEIDIPGLLEAIRPMIA